MNLHACSLIHTHDKSLLGMTRAKKFIQHSWKSLWCLIWGEWHGNQKNRVVYSGMEFNSLLKPEVFMARKDQLAFQSWWWFLSFCVNHHRKELLSDVWWMSRWIFVVWRWNWSLFSIARTQAEIFWGQLFSLWLELHSYKISWMKWGKGEVGHFSLFWVLGIDFLIWDRDYTQSHINSFSVYIFFCLNFNSHCYPKLPFEFWLLINVE